jgi:hypothetical protein
MLPRTGHFGRRSWSRWIAGWRDPEDDLDAAVVDFDAAHDGANDISHTKPIEMIEPGDHLSRKVFQPADHEGKVAFGLGSLASSLVPGLQLGHALFQARNAWLELGLVDDALGIAVDESTNPPS